MKQPYVGAQAIEVNPNGHDKLASYRKDGVIRLLELGIGETLRTMRHDRPYESLNITGIRDSQGEIATLWDWEAVEDKIKVNRIQTWQRVR